MITSLNQIVDTFSQTYTDSTVQICDEQLYFRFVGSRLLEYLDIESADIENKRLINVDCSIQHLSQQYLKLHIPLLKGKVKEISYTTYLNHESTLVIARNKVKPIILKDKIVGLFIDTKVNHNLLNFDFSIIANKLNHTPATIVNDLVLPNTNFSELEELIIFLIVIGKIDKEIAEILHSIGIFLSRSGITKLISRKLFPKLQVDTRTQLVSLVFYRGLIQKVPTLISSNKQLLNLAFTNTVFN